MTVMVSRDAAEVMARDYLAPYEGTPGFERAVRELTAVTWRMMRLARRPSESPRERAR